MSNEEVEKPFSDQASDNGLDTDAGDQRMNLATTKSLEQHVSLPREILVVGLICLSQFTTQVGLGGTLSILHIIGDNYGITNPGTLSWLIAGYSLTVGTFILLTGRLGDLFGWKRMLVIGYIWYAVWSLIAGLAVYSNHVLFVFARVFQGIGPSICMPNGLALLGALYAQGPRKNMAFAVFGATAPGGSIVGAAFGALFALAWWPWHYWSFSIVLTCIGVAAAFVIPDPQDAKPGLRGKTLAGAVQELDLLGAAAGVTGLVLFNFAWNQAPIVGWQSPYVIVTLILGVLLMPVFMYIEVKVAKTPLLPLDVFTSDNAFVLACIAAGWSCFGIWVYYLWQTLEVLRGASPLLASAYISPVAISGAFAAVLTGLLLGKLRPAWVMVGAMTAFCVGTIFVATVPVHEIYWGRFFFTTLITTFGMDMSFPSATLVVSNSVDKAHQGVAASLVNTIVNYSISLGLGFAGTVEVHINHGGKTPADIQTGYRGALWMGVGLSGLGIAVSLFFLFKSYRDDHRRRLGEQRGKEVAA